MRYFVVEMPVYLATGEGPVTDGTHDKILWELWNPHMVCVAEFDTREMAERAAQIINEDLEGAAVRGA